MISQKIEDIINSIGDLDNISMRRCQKRLDNLTKPQGSLGRLEELARSISGITGKEIPRIKNKVIFVAAADHGVTEENISAFPKEVTAQMVLNFLNGQAAINVLARHAGARVIVADLGVCRELFTKGKVPAAKGGKCTFLENKINLGTKNMAKGPAMSHKEAVRSIETGIKIFNEQYRCRMDIIGIGEMGIGNTTPSSAITACLAGKSPERVTGTGTGISTAGLKNKIEAIKKALKVNRPDPYDPVDVLAKIGGFEIGGLAGIILAASAKRVPVVLDGFISGAAALLAFKLAPKVKNYLIASHCSVEKGHKVILDHIGLAPLFDLNLRLGEGTGAALGINLAEAAIKILAEMATFEGARVSGKK